MKTAILFTIACKDKNEDGNSVSAREIVLSKTWKRGLEDKTPSVLPSGRSSYNDCLENESSVESVSYTYNKESGELVMSGLRYKVLENSKNQVRFNLATASVSRYDNIVYLNQ